MLIPVKYGNDAVLIDADDRGFGQNFDIRILMSFLNQSSADGDSAVSGVLLLRAEELMRLLHQLTAGNVISFADQHMCAQRRSGGGSA